MPWMRYDANLRKLYNALGQTAKIKSNILSNLFKYENKVIPKIKAKKIAI